MTTIPAYAPEPEAAQPQEPAPTPAISPSLRAEIAELLTQPRPRLHAGTDLADEPVVRRLAHISRLFMEQGGKLTNLAAHCDGMSLEELRRELKFLAAEFQQTKPAHCAPIVVPASASAPCMPSETGLLPFALIAAM
jgi:hypothetical protein